MPVRCELWTQTHNIQDTSSTQANGPLQYDDNVQTSYTTVYSWAHTCLRKGSGFQNFKLWPEFLKIVYISGSLSLMIVFGFLDCARVKFGNFDDWCSAFCLLCFSTRLIWLVENKMVSRAPTWSLLYKNLGRNPEVNQKMQRIMDFNQS